MNHLNRSHGSKVMAKTAKWVKTGLSATRTQIYHFPEIIITQCDSHPILSFSGNSKYPVRPAPPSATRTAQCDPHPRKVATVQTTDGLQLAPVGVLGCDPHPWMRPAADQISGPDLLYRTQKLECDSHPNLTVSDIKGILARIFHSNFQFPPFFTLLLRSRSRD